MTSPITNNRWYKDGVFNGNNSATLNNITEFAFIDINGYYIRIAEGVEG